MRRRRSRWASFLRMRNAVSASDIEEAEEAAASGPASFLDDEEDLDIQEMILGEIDGEDAEGESESPDDGAPSEVSAEAPPDAEAQSEEEPVAAASAEVREKGGRFQHRVSRRRRRRGDRGDRPGEPRAAADAQPRPEAEPQPATAARP